MVPLRARSGTAVDSSHELQLVMRTFAVAPLSTLCLFAILTRLQTRYFETSACTPERLLRCARRTPATDSSIPNELENWRIGDNDLPTIQDLVKLAEAGTKQT